MSKSVNKVTILGRLGRDPEVKYTASGTAMYRFSVATDESWKDKSSGERRESTEWHNVVAWGKLGETCGEYLAKGRQVYLEGSLTTREWDDSDGNKRRVTEIKASDVVFLGGRGEQRDGEAREKLENPPGGPITDEDLPW